MRLKNPKAKGGAFEREVAKSLSLFVTSGKRADCFWRSSLSGGRATVAHLKGKDVRQCGDICAVAPEGNAFSEQWYVECKHMKTLKIGEFIVKRTGPLYRIWKHTIKCAKKFNRDPLLIVRQNTWPTLCISRTNHLAHWIQPWVHTDGMDISLFDALVQSRYEPPQKRVQWR